MSSNSTSSTSLEPTLYSLIPSSIYKQFLNHLSLNSIYNENLEIIDRIYLNSINSIIPNQIRNLRFRSIKNNNNNNKENWINSLSYISNSLKSREYSEILTKALINLNILSEQDEFEIKDFINSLGFIHSHTYIQKGHLFHISLPTNQLITLQLSITHVIPLKTDSTFETNYQITNNDDPWLIQLYPSKPVNAVSTQGELNYSSIVEMMQDFVGNLGFPGLIWSTGNR
ncbi:uncharacterized protein I206_106958 [Kwoniella pini CBS 10737]|uniref:Uncharacterized protein n=1 Tax=Kwoniella pini CBS 10737 TaxID=1296096 RepID=A0A1B9HZK5_9TREE|nr:uncharacterized protein I206_05500 [Kwoniella pini CBS 10737]OCF48719.1 hypothetical protein I206_05500 [Kwoniella pini CBS 10737]